jgi:chromosome segregation ATPase
MKTLQPKFQQAMVDSSKFRAERDAALSQATTLNQIIEKRVADNVKLREEKASLLIELTEARTALSNSTVPDLAKLGEAQDQVRAITAEKERLEKRVTSMQREVEFTRDSYQKASSYSSELSNEINELRAENDTLKRKATENILRIAEIQRNNEAKEQAARIDELEALLRDREMELHKKYEELKIKTNGRRETRGTSVPRSPRIGAGGVSPRPHFARTAAGSRGGSPAPEGYRDPPLFPPSGSGRGGSRIYAIQRDT